MCPDQELNPQPLPLLIKAPALKDQGLTLMIFFNLNYLPESPSPNTITFGVKISTNDIVGSQNTHLIIVTLPISPSSPILG